MDIEAYFETDSIAVVKGSTFTNFLVVKNTSDVEITVQELAPQEKYPGLLFYPKANFTLAAGAQKRLPLKFIANLDFMKRPSNKIAFSFSFKTSTIFKSAVAAFYLQKEEDTTISIYPFSRENYLNPATPESSLMVFVENRGYAKRNIKLEFQSLPDGLTITPNQQTVTLEGLEKRIVEIRVATRNQNVLYPDYNIQVKATDLIDSENVGSSQIQLVVLSSNRQIARGVDLGRGNNYAEVTYNENSSGFNYMQLRGNTEFSASENLYGRFNINTDYYMQDGLYNLYDTWLELEHKNSVMRIGNVQGSDYDYSVSGRGGKITTRFGATNQLEVLGLENNYSLYGTYFQQTEGSKMAGAKYSFGSSNNFNGKLSYIFERDPRLSIDTQVANLTSLFSISEQHNFRLEGGLSHEKGLLSNDQNTGASAELNYDATIGNWNFQSTNSYASKAYAGLSRGAYFFNQRIGREFSKGKRVFLLYQRSQVQPEYLSFQNTINQANGYGNYPKYFHSTGAVKLGYQFTVQNWNFLVSPQVEQQKNESNAIARGLLSYRFHANIGTSFGNHGLNLSGDYAKSKQENSTDWFNSLRATMSYRFNNFSLNGTVQKNPINVYELNSYHYSGQGFINYNVYSSYNFQAFKGALSGSASAGVNYSELYQNLNKTVTGNLEYKISNNWATTGYLNYSDYESIQSGGYSGYNYQFRVGLKKYFAVATSLGNHKVSFQLFEDANFNGVLDSGEQVLANEVIKLDRYVAMTDKKGKVTFQNVPQGIYKLEVNQSAGARLKMDPMIVVDRNIKMNVGLVKAIRVSGKLKEIRQAYDFKETSVTGIAVYAKSEEGVVHTAVVNQNDEFEFFLKDGEYDIFIKNDKYNFINPKQTIVIGNTENAEILLFEYKKKDTEIKVKRF
ncbi:hypothetical protein GCM10007383_14360 [Arenibacter certesii]|uniref:SD-repeat containing protein B domain-containing protein n=1 Tax=Arenibacter certesii TaxID=228955 RepID=A0A918ISM5_9FLAO|nr:hypothetical protein GCM10007383_14360 [Arenibacter certesii]